MTYDLIASKGASDGKATTFPVSLLFSGKGVVVKYWTVAESS